MAGIDPDAAEHIPPAAASAYAKLAAAYGQEYYRSVADDLAEQVRPGDRLLDVGTGPGLLPVLLATRLGEIQVHAFDRTADLIEYGRRAAERDGVADRVSFFRADCYAIPVRDRSHSGLLSTGVLHSLDDPVAALAEFHRVLEPGGTAWMFDPTILAIPDDPDIDLTDHERAVVDAYRDGAGDDGGTYSVAEAEELVADSPFPEAVVQERERGDLRIVLTRQA